jgi:hypothetical protein
MFGQKVKATYWEIRILRISAKRQQILESIVIEELLIVGCTVK